MTELASKDYENVPVPRRVKISSKRQITIPVDIYERQGFSEYAMLTETESGFTIQPVELTDDDEELTLMLLRYLIGKGFEGEALLDKYAEIKPKFVSFHKAIAQSEADIAAGRVIDAETSLRRIREKYGL